MRRWLSACSTSLPITWNVTSIWNGYWTLLAAEPDKRDQQRRQDEAGADEQPQRAADVGRRRMRPATLAHEGLVDLLAVIGARAGDGEAERAGESRLRPAGIGRAVIARIAAHGLPAGA